VRWGDRHRSCSEADVPGKRNSLDALCDRFGISNAHRTLHGALLDSDCWQKLSGNDAWPGSLVNHDFGEMPQRRRSPPPRISLDDLQLPVLWASEEELSAHLAVLDDLDKAVKGTSVWRIETVSRSRYGGFLIRVDPGNAIIEVLKDSLTKRPSST